MFTVRIPVRAGDLDVNGHVRGPAYLEYADHARWCCVRAAGLRLDELAAAGLGPVNLETTVTFHRELRGDEELTVATRFTYHGKTGRAEQELRTADGTLVATVRSVTGVLDLRSRRLAPDGADRVRDLVTDPAPLGL